MSKYVDDLIIDLKQHPLTFSAIEGGVRKDNVKVYQHGNTALLSIVRVEIDGRDTPMSYFDKYQTEKAVSKWYRNVPLHKLKMC